MPSPEMSDPLLTVNEAAEYLRCLPSYLRRLLHERRLSYVRVGGRMIRLRRSDLDALLETVEARRPLPRLSLDRQIGRLPGAPADSGARTIDCRFCLGVLDHVPACPVVTKITKQTNKQALSDAQDPG